MQSRRSSFIEANVNVFSGMIIAFAISQIAHVYEAEIQQYIWKGFVWKVSVGSNVLMTIVLTIVSMLRGYSWRRYFNQKQLRSYNETAKK